MRKQKREFCSAMTDWEKLEKIQCTANFELWSPQNKFPVCFAQNAFFFLFAYRRSYLYILCLWYEMVGMEMHLSIASSMSLLRWIVATSLKKKKTFTFFFYFLAAISFLHFIEMNQIQKLGSSLSNPKCWSFWVTSLSKIPPKPFFTNNIF